MRDRGLAKISVTFDFPAQKGRNHLVAVNLSGRGDNDLASVAEQLGGKR